jgi:hypothetical protein
LEKFPKPGDRKGRPYISYWKSGLGHVGATLAVAQYTYEAVPCKEKDGFINWF